MLNIKNLFPWCNVNQDLIYMDTAATSLKPQVVIDAINQYVLYQSTNPHNADSLFTYKAHTVIDECRKISAQLINADHDEIIFTSGATEGLNLIANAIGHSIHANDEILLTYYEHTSNLLPWYNLRDEKHAKIVFANRTEFSLTSADFVKQLSPHTKIVSFTGCSNVLGNMLPIKEIVIAIRKYNPKILICVDLAQMIPHTKCDVKLWDVDFCVYSGHKIFADTGIGVVYIKHNLQPHLKPFKYGGGMNDIVTPTSYTFAPHTDKYEAGTPNVSGIYSLLAATKFLMQIGYDKIRNHETEIYELLHSQLSTCKHLNVYNWEAKSSILAFNLKDVYSQDLAAYLGKHNMIVRAGLSCAKLLDNIIPEKGLVRASFSIYNTQEDVLQFIKILKNITREKVLHELI